jgi:hypothetical protein
MIRHNFIKIPFLPCFSICRLCISASWTNVYWSKKSNLDLSALKSNIAAYSEWPIHKTDLSRWIGKIAPGLRQANVAGEHGGKVASSYFDGFKRREIAACDFDEILAILGVRNSSNLQTLRTPLSLQRSAFDSAK